MQEEILGETDKMEKITINMIISTRNGNNKNNIQLVLSNDAIISGSTEKINEAIMLYDASDNIKYIVERGCERQYASKNEVLK